MEESSSEDSNFSGARPGSSVDHSKRKRKENKKRAGKTHLDDFDDSEFTWKERESDMDRSDGGTLGASLEKRLNGMSSPSGGQGPKKTRKKKENRNQDGGGNVRRSAGHGGEGRSRSTNAGRTQRRGGGYSSYLDQAEDEQARDMGAADHNSSKPFSLTGSPTAQTSTERAATSKKVGKGKNRGHKAPPEQGWTNSRNCDQELKLMVGKGKGKTPSTMSKRSKDKRALDLSKSNACHGQLEAGPTIDMTSDNDDDANVKGGSSRKRTLSPEPSDAGSDDKSYGVADVFSSESGMKASTKKGGVDWELNSDYPDLGGFSSSDSSEDFADKSLKDECSDGKRKKRARTSNKNGSSKPIDITEDDEETSATPGSLFSKMTGSVKKILQRSGSGSKRAKDEQGVSGMCEAYLPLLYFDRS